MTDITNPVTVGELIKQLRKLDPATTVVVNDTKLGMVSAKILVDSLHYDAERGHYCYFVDNATDVLHKHLIIYGKKDDKR